MNLVLGSTGVLLGLSAAVLGVVTLALRAGEEAPRPPMARGALHRACWSSGALLAVVAMERALITRDFTVKFVADNGSSRTPALYNVATLWAALEGSIILWGLILAGYTAVVVGKFRHRLSDPLVGWAVLTMFVVCRVLLLPDGVPGQPVPDVLAAAGLRRSRPEPAAAEPSAHGVPPADALPRLRRVHRAVRVRHRCARHRPCR